MRKILTSVFILTLAFSGTAYAGSETATLYVKASVVASVGVTCSPLNFPPFDRTDVGKQIQGEGTVSVNSTVNYSISLDAGRYFNGSARCMDSAKKLEYRLYQDAAHATEWGDSNVAGTYVSGTSKSGLPGNNSHTVYGTLTTASVDEGDYQDSVIVTVTY